MPVDAGTGETLQIVCGAPNVKPGIPVPCALVGAVLPPSEPGGKPFEIKVGKLRGVDSYGMLCSARELKLSEDHEGLLILPEDAPVGQNIREYRISTIRSSSSSSRRTRPTACRSTAWHAKWQRSPVPRCRCRQ